MTVGRNNRKQDNTRKNQKMAKGFATLHRKALGINNLCYLENHFDGTRGPPGEASAPCKTLQIYGIVRCTDNHNVLSEKPKGSTRFL